MKLKWYPYRQNNSGGSFTEDQNQGPQVFIQAESAAGAWSMAQEMFDFEYCECCGERWYEAEEDDGQDEPTVYGVPVNEVTQSFFVDYAILHHFNGVVEKVTFKKGVL